ncbi:hypothetical protein PREVCOP_05798 [Segatella copri DSM 18205]|uniref:Uncharacterized protein n=1 Tax=Segatella copri DSM 18205 TaxID=537011 RepID=D1PEZ3_9BACT|nr:hypothetical protein PREVCOP_05798 [Segatella copri DSM 18205]
MHASTRAAKRNTFFIAFYIFIFITLIYIYPILPIVLSGAKFAKKNGNTIRKIPISRYEST